MCLTCGEREAVKRKHTIAPMHKSNYLVITNLDDLKGLNNKGGKTRWDIEVALSMAYATRSGTDHDGQREDLSADGSGVWLLFLSEARANPATQTGDGVRFVDEGEYALRRETDGGREGLISEGTCYSTYTEVV
jgi:hypothetical protein